MKPFLRYLIFSICCLAATRELKAQQRQPKDTVIQLYGIVMTADSLQAVPGASVYIDGKGRGTIANDQGVFSIVVQRGDKVRFSSVGFLDQVYTIPDSMKYGAYDLIRLMVTNEKYLPAVIVKPRPTREQFERDFVNANTPNDAYEIARQNTEESKRRVLIASLPQDGRESVNMQMRQQAARYYYQGQQPPINILNPAAWAEFIQAWKRGDFKSKK
jgi:hypothetical protein